ncbi:condensation domain-containing protein [Micromonospora echinaurantiaca]|nr:condensation domain-containing protein [Micromonospora echinaurantiaca]
MQELEVREESLPESTISTREHLIARAFAVELGLPCVDPDECFFENGGTSLNAVLLVANLQRQGLRVSLDQIARFPTARRLARVAVERDDAATIIHPAPEGRIPLLPMQQEWLANGIPRPGSNVVGFLLNASEPLDFAAMDAAVRAVVDHHDGLQLRLNQHDWPRTQRLDRTPAGPFLRMLARFPDDELELQRIADELRSDLDPIDGPVVRGALFPGSDDEVGRLLIVVHHFCVDAVSMQIVLADLDTAYMQIRNDNQVVLQRRSSSILELAQAASMFHLRPSAAESVTYWLEQAELLRSEDTEPRLTLTRRRTGQIIKEICGVRPSVRVLFGALAYAVRRSEMRDVLAVRMTHHGRGRFSAQLDLARTVGWLATQIPVVLDLRAIQSVGGAMALVDQALARALRFGENYQSLAQWLAGPAGAIIRSVREQSDVTFNYYLRQPNLMRDAQLAPANQQPHFMPTDTTRVPAMALYISGDFTGPMSLRWQFDPAIYDTDLIDRLAETQVAAIKEVCDGDK